MIKMGIKEIEPMKLMILSIIILGIIILSISIYLGIFTNKGYYKITDMWIGDNNKVSNYLIVIIVYGLNLMKDVIEE